MPLSDDDKRDIRRIINQEVNEVGHWLNRRQYHTRVIADRRPGREEGAKRSLASFMQEFSARGMARDAAIAELVQEVASLAADRGQEVDVEALLRRIEDRFEDIALRLVVEEEGDEAEAPKS